MKNQKILLWFDDPIILNRTTIPETVGPFELLGTTQDGGLVVRRSGSKKLERWHPTWFGMQCFDFSCIGDLDTRITVVVSEIEKMWAKHKDAPLRKEVQILIDQAEEMMSHEPPPPDKAERFFRRGRAVVDQLNHYLSFGKLKGEDDGT